MGSVRTHRAPWELHVLSPAPVTGQDRPRPRVRFLIYLTVCLPPPPAGETGKGDLEWELGLLWWGRGDLGTGLLLRSHQTGQRAPDAGGDTGQVPSSLWALVSPPVRGRVGSVSAHPRSLYWVSGAQSPAPLSPPPRALSSHPREVLGCECHRVISSDQEAHYLGGGPQVTYFWPSQPGQVWEEC